MNVIYNGSMIGNEGLCVMGREIIKQLDKSHTVKFDLPHKIGGYWEKFHESFKGKEDVYIMNGHTPHLPKIAANGHKTIISIVTFETDLPKDWIDALQIPEVKEIWTISEFGKKLIEDAGITKPIKVLYLGIDKTFRPKEVNIFPKDKSFKFLNISAPHGLGIKDRKGLDIAIKAFKEEFRDDPNVTLVLKINTIYADAYNKNLARKFNLQQYLLSLLPPGEKPNNISVVTNYYPVDILNDLYNSVDCGIFPSRGECFGLPQAEMMSLGKPVITTAYSAPQEFSDAHLQIKVKELEPLDYDQYPYNQSLFAEPDVQHLKKLMREVYENYKIEQDFAKDHAKTLTSFTWDNTGLKMNQFLKEFVKNLGDK